MDNGRDHIEWMYREACVRSAKQARASHSVGKGQWFVLACTLENLYPDVIREYRKRMGVDVEVA